MGESRHTSITVLLAGLTVVALSACSADSTESRPGPSDPLSRLEIGFEPVSVPNALRGSSPRVIEQDLLPAAAGGTATIVTRSLLPDAQPVIQLWQPETSTSATTTIDVRGATSVVADASPAVALVAGNRLDARRRLPWAKVSTDRVTWQDLPLPEPSGALAVTEAAVVEDRVVLTASDDSRTDWVSIGDRTSAGAFTKLPTPSGREADVAAVSGHDDEVLVAREVGTRGGVTNPFVVLSADRGATWSEHAVTGLDGVSGIVWTGTDYVATGWTRSSGADEFTAAAARSRDGRTWVAESIPTPGPNDVAVRSQSYLGTPRLSQGTVQARYACNCVASQVYERSATGTWRSVGETTRSHEPDAAGMAWRSRSGAHMSVIDRSSLKHYATISASDELVSTTLTAATEPATVGGVMPYDDGTDIVTASRRTLNILPDGNWSSTSLPVNFTYASRFGVVDSPTSVAPVKDFDDLSAATDGRGNTVFVGTVFRQLEDRGSWRVGSLARSRGQGGWASGKGLDVEEFTLASDVVHSGSFWYAAVTAASDASYQTTRRTRVLRSSDGRNWNAMEGEWDKANSGSEIRDLCTMKGGAPLAVGSVTSSDRTLSHAATWTLSGGRWVASTLVDKGGSRSMFTKCAEAPSGAVLSGSIGDRSATWTTSNGTAIGRPTTTGDNESRGPAENFGGVLLAAGTTSTHDNSGPVIWVSESGETWKAVPLPADSGTSSVSLERGADAPLVVVDSGNGTRVWRVTGLTSPTPTPPSSPPSSPSVSSSP